MEASVVLEGMDTWERLHGLSGIGVAEQADLLQRQNVGGEGDLPSRGGDLDYSVGSGDTGSTDDDLLDILHTIKCTRLLSREGTRHSQKSQHCKLSHKRKSGWLMMPGGEHPSQPRGGISRSTTFYIIAQR